MSIKDVMKLLDDNQQETESATVPQLWGPEPSLLSEPQGQTQMNNVSSLQLLHRAG